MTATDFAVLITKFLTEYLPLHRNCSKNTISSYKDSLKLFIFSLLFPSSSEISSTDIPICAIKQVHDKLSHIFH